MSAEIKETVREFLADVTESSNKVKTHLEKCELQQALKAIREFDDSRLRLEEDLRQAHFPKEELDEAFKQLREADINMDRIIGNTKCTCAAIK